MSKLHFQLDHSPHTDDYTERGKELTLRMTRELILNPEGLNPDPALERLRLGAPAARAFLSPENTTAEV